MNKAYLGMLILALTCLQWGCFNTPQAAAQQSAQSVVGPNQNPNQDIIDQLQDILRDQARFGKTPRNNGMLRQIQTAIKRFPSTPMRPSTPMPPAGQCKYVITVTTGRDVLSPNSNIFQADGPGTDANVTFTIFGNRGQQVTLGPISGAQNGYRRGHYLFEFGDRNVLRTQGVDIGKLSSIRIRRDNTNSASADWQVDSISVEKQTLGGAFLDSKTAWFNNWLTDTRPQTRRLQ